MSAIQERFSEVTDTETRKETVALALRAVGSVILAASVIMLYAAFLTLWYDLLIDAAVFEGVSATEARAFWFFFEVPAFVICAPIGVAVLRLFVDDIQWLDASVQTATVGVALFTLAFLADLALGIGVFPILDPGVPP